MTINHKLAELKFIKQQTDKILNIILAQNSYTGTEFESAIDKVIIETFDTGKEVQPYEKTA